MGKTYTKQMQSLANRYLAVHKGPAPTRDIAAWIITNGLWAPQRADLINQCADQLARAMREEYFTDPQGRVVRAKHAARIARGGEQTSLWSDIRTASRAHMHIAFQQRRQQILGECRQLKVDVDSYNQNRNPGNPIQMVFDFTRDLEEVEAAA